MKFAYKRFSNGVQRPVIPITIRNPKTDQSVRHFALIDSDLSIFSSEIADIIGIVLAAGIRQSVSGVVARESRPYYLYHVEIEVGGYHAHGPGCRFLRKQQLSIRA